MENCTKSNESKSLPQLIQILQNTANRPELTTELETLDAILGEQVVHSNYQHQPNQPIQSIQLTVDLQLNLEPPVHQTSFRLIIQIPDEYPASSEIPTLDILSRSIGPFKVEPELLNYIHNSHLRLLPHDQILYDLILNSKDLVERFYLDKCHLQAQQDEQSQLISSNSKHVTHQQDPKPSTPPNSKLQEIAPLNGNIDFQVHSSSPILDRKSTFVGHSVSIVHPNQVACIIQQLLSDKKIAKASHNIVAWRCEVNGCLHQDNDDDGETAAGSRMLHLLSILNVKNVFVCVSRWFGGIHLGADRFKHINQATRDALMVGGFIPSHNQPKSSLRAKKIR